MKWKYLLATTALMGTIGTGFYYRKNMRKVLSRLETAGATENSAGLHAIVQQVYQQTRPQTQKGPRPFAQKEKLSLLAPEQFFDKARELKEGLVLFAYTHSQEILAGKYDQKLDALVQNAGRYFGKLEHEGRERLHTLYGQLGDKMNATLLKLRREMCREEVQNMARDIGQVLDKYQK